MATYSELFDLRSDANLRNRITTAVAIQADVIRLENVNTANHANRLIWAKEAFVNPEAVANKMMWGILAANKNITPDQTKGVTDASLQTAVANLVDVFATGG